MAVKLRFQILGVRNNRYFKLVATDSKRGRNSGNYIEDLGTYNPRLDKRGHRTATINFDRCKYWLSQGAQPSPAVWRLLAYAGEYMN